MLDGLDYLDRSCCIYDGTREKIYMFYQAPERCDKKIIGDLQEYLPKYMCPNKYVYMEQLPLNKNGKIDRSCLREVYINAVSYTHLDVYKRQRLSRRVRG